MLGLLGASLAWAASASASPPDPPPPVSETPTASEFPTPATELLAHLGEGELRHCVAEVLERSPELEALERRIRGLEQRARQAGTLPDPSINVSLFALPVETRVGPQRFSISAQQALPWKAERSVDAERARLEAARLGAEREALRLRLLTRARELWIELAFVREHQRILDQKRDHLRAHEEAARVRYANGQGSAQGPLKLQTELTRLDAERLAVAEREPMLWAELNGLRDRWLDDAPAPTPELERLSLPDLSGDRSPDVRLLAERALERRPEMAGLELARRHAGLGIEKAELSRRPDLRVGLAFTAVEGRRDDAGRALPPEGNGDDILALTAGIGVPLWSERYDAMLGEAAEAEAAVGADARAMAARIRRQVAEMAARLPLEAQQLGLLEGVLAVQSEESVRAAVSGYGTGILGVLDLLDAEHRLFEVRLAAARARADLALAIARLEGAIAGPLDTAPAPALVSEGSTEEEP